jgi:HD superfamily phosphohydrolase
MQFLTETEDSQFVQRTPHEIFSYLIATSEPVRKYFNRLAKETKKDFNVNISRMSGWILGIPEDEDNKFRFRAEILNGPFDADKLDYIFRDGYFSGLPLGLDLDRLWASCEKSVVPGSGANILTLSQNSATPLEQIIFNKINLFSVVYHHPKVRSAECMFKGVVEYVKEHPGEVVADRDLKKATDFLWLTDDIIFAEALKRKGDDPLHKMIHDILYRRLFVRALTISSDTVEEAEENPDYWALRELNAKTKAEHETSRQLAERIWEEAGKPHTKHHIWIDLPHDPPTSEPDRVYVRYPVRETPGYSLRKLSDLFPLNYWVQLYTQHKWRGHVFCPKDCQQQVYEASKKVIGENYGVKFKKSAGEISHVPHP